MPTFLAIVVFGGFIAFLLWGSIKMNKQKSEDKDEIVAMSNEELITDYKRTNYQINALPKNLMHGDIHRHSRLMKNLSTIEKELKKRGIK